VVLAKSVASLTLVKAVWFGADVNWGRALCARGYPEIDFDPHRVEVTTLGQGPGSSGVGR
jgi:glutamate N-acetyltransferase/amino-acid N-acetyltransferase